jgi:hypothetical protein
MANHDETPATSQEEEEYFTIGWPHSDDHTHGTNSRLPLQTEVTIEFVGSSPTTAPSEHNGDLAVRFPGDPPETPENAAVSRTENTPQYAPNGSSDRSYDPTARRAIQNPMGCMKPWLWDPWIQDPDNSDWHIPTGQKPQNWISDPHFCTADCNPSLIVSHDWAVHRKIYCDSSNSPPGWDNSTLPRIFYRDDVPTSLPPPDASWLIPTSPPNPPTTINDTEQKSGKDSSSITYSEIFQPSPKDRGLTENDWYPADEIQPKIAKKNMLFLRRFARNKWGIVDKASVTMPVLLRTLRRLFPMAPPGTLRVQVYVIPRGDASADTDDWGRGVIPLLIDENYNLMWPNLKPHFEDYVLPRIRREMLQMAAVNRRVVSGG